MQPKHKLTKRSNVRAVMLAIAAAGGHIKKGFVDGQPFHQGRYFAKQREHLPRHFLVALHARAHYYQLRATPSCFTHRHGAMDAEDTHGIARGGYHASVAFAAHHHWQSGQGRVVVNLHGGEERIHVDMQNGAVQGGEVT